MDLRQNLIDRYTMKNACEVNAYKRAQCMELCKRDILFFFRYWLFTYDPRKSPSDLPFIPYDYQEKYIEELNQCIINGESRGTEKTRDMGATWMILGTFLYRWLFWNENFLLGSRKEETVDTIGDMDSHFERLRYMISKLPNWMVEACEFDRKNIGYMKIYKANGASLTGESMNTGFSRQGRYKAILLDEFAFVEKSDIIWRACGDSAPCKLPVSTPNGTHNFFYHLKKSGKLKFFTLHWSMHPEKGEAWYKEECKKRDPKDIAQELDINYSISAGDPFYRGFSRALHLRKMNISKDKELILSWDYGFQHPNCTVNQISAEGIWIIVDNIFGENQLIEEFAEYVNTYLQQTYPGYSFRKIGFGDPAGKQASDKSRRSSEQILNDKGFRVRSIPSNSALSNYDARKTIIENRLRTLIGGVPALVVNDVPNNAIIAEGFEGGYRYPDANKYGGISEKPVDDGWFEHPFNCIEYMAINMFRPVRKIDAPRKVSNRIKQWDEAVNAGIGYGN